MPGIIGEDDGPESRSHLKDLRASTLLFKITQRLLYTKVARPGRRAQAVSVRPTKAHNEAMARRMPHMQGWRLSRTTHVSGTSRHGLRTNYAEAITRAQGIGSHPGARQCSTRIIPVGSTAHVKLQYHQDPPDTKPIRESVPRKLGAVLDSNWEAEFCRVAEVSSAV